MSHVFDHGLSLPVRTLVRLAAIARLAPKARANGGYLEAIEPFPYVVQGVRDEDGVDHAFQVLNGRAPAVLIALGDKRFESTSTTQHRYQGDLGLQVLIVSNSSRGLLDRLTLDPVAEADDTADPGADVILEHVAELLIGCDLGIGSKVQDPRPVSEEHLGTEEALTLWALNFTISAAASVKPTREQLERLSLIVSTLTAPAAEGVAGDVVVELETEIPPL